jgi:hypothetical protein
VQGSGSQPESACEVCGGSPQNRQVTSLSHKTKTGGSAGRNGIQTRREASMLEDTWRDRGACVGRTRIAAKAWPLDEKYEVLTKVPLGVCVLLCNRGNFVFRMPPYKLNGERMAAISWNPSSFAS